MAAKAEQESASYCSVRLLDSVSRRSKHLVQSAMTGGSRCVADLGFEILTGSRGSIAANSTRFGRARSSDEKIVLEPRLKVTVEDSLRHNMRLPFDASVETTKT